MTIGRTDRRIERTRRRLKQAALELINQKSFDAISIRDIAERAEVGRSTFYTHFRTKEELLFSGFEHGLLAMARSRSGGRSKAADVKRFRFSLPLLEHIRSQKRFFHATMVQGGNSGIRIKTTRILAEVVRVELSRLTPARTPAREREAQTHAVVGAFLGLASWWLERGGRLSAGAVDDVFQRIAKGLVMT